MDLKNGFDEALPISAWWWVLGFEWWSGSLEWLILVLILILEWLILDVGFAVCNLVKWWLFLGFGWWSESPEWRNEEEKRNEEREKKKLK